MSCHYATVHVIPNVHFLSIHFRIELKKADRTRHSVLLAFVVDEESVFQQTLHQLRSHVDENRSLLTNRDVVEATLHHDLVEEIFVLVITTTALDQYVELLDHLLLEVLETRLHVLIVALGVAEAGVVELR